MMLSENSNFLSQHSLFQEVELGKKQVECESLNRDIEKAAKEYAQLVSVIIIYIKHLSARPAMHLVQLFPVVLALCLCSNANFCQYLFR